MDEQPHADHGQQHQPERQLDDGGEVLEQLVLGDTPAVEEQERRQKQEHEQLGVELDAMRGGQADRGAQQDLHQRRGHAERKHPRDCAADDDGEQQEQDDRNGFHGSASFCAAWRPRLGSC
ncbi:hypothetical protein QU38_00320, partial [Staphylococcus aureus]